MSPRRVQPASGLRSNLLRLASKKFTDTAGLSSVSYKSIADWKSIALKPLWILILCVWHGPCCHCAVETRIQRMCEALTKYAKETKVVMSHMNFSLNHREPHCPPYLRARALRQENLSDQKDLTHVGSSYMPTVDECTRGKRLRLR